jgi:hypothetical protein
MKLKGLMEGKRLTPNTLTPILSDGEEESRESTFQTVGMGRSTSSHGNWYHYTRAEITNESSGRGGLLARRRQ